MWITLQFKGKMRVLARQRCLANKNRYHLLLFSIDWVSCPALRGSLCLTQCGKSVLIVCGTNCLRNSLIPGLDHYRQALMIICSLCLRRTGLSRTLSRISILSEYVSFWKNSSQIIYSILHWRLVLPIQLTSRHPHTCEQCGSLCGSRSLAVTQ